MRRQNFVPLMLAPPYLSVVIEVRPIMRSGQRNKDVYLSESAEYPQLWPSLSNLEFPYFFLPR